MGIHSPEQIKADADLAAQGKDPETGVDIPEGTEEQFVALHYPRFKDMAPNDPSDYARRARLILNRGKQGK